MKRGSKKIWEREYPSWHLFQAAVTVAHCFFCDVRSWRLWKWTIFWLNIFCLIQSLTCNIAIFCLCPLVLKPDTIVMIVCISVGLSHSWLYFWDTEWPKLCRCVVKQHSSIHPSLMVILCRESEVQILPVARTIVWGVFHTTRKLARFSPPNMPSIVNSLFRIKS